MLCIIKFVRCPGQTVILEGNEFLWNKRKTIPAIPTYRHWKQSVTFVWNESINFGLITSKLKKTYFKEVPKISWGNFHHVIQIITPSGNLDPTPPAKNSNTFVYALSVHVSLSVIRIHGYQKILSIVGIFHLKQNTMISDLIWFFFRKKENKVFLQMEYYRFYKPHLKYTVLIITKAY